MNKKWKFFDIGEEFYRWSSDFSFECSCGEYLICDESLDGEEVCPACGKKYKIEIKVYEEIDAEQ